MKNYPFVSIIFPNYNGGEEPLECLRSIEKLNYPKNKIETIVVDNNSNDGSNKKAKRNFPSIKLINLAKNAGFAKSINIGISLAEGAFIFIGNDDITFDRNSLIRMVEYLIKNQDVGVVGGKIFLKSQPKKVCSSGYMMNKWTGNIYVAKNKNLPISPDWIQGCAMLVPRLVFTTIGFLDEDFFPIYFEDYDFCLRARKEGYKIIYLPDAIFWHAESKTMNRNMQNKYYQWYKNKIRFCIKNLPLLKLFTILFIQTFVITPYRLIVLHDGRFIPFLKGMYWNIKYLKQTMQIRKTI